MNRAERRKYIKRINTPQKIENFSKEIDRNLRMEYEKKSDQKIQNFIHAYTVLCAYILDYELENEEHLRIAGRKNKNVSPQIASVIKYFMMSLNKHLDLLEDGTISIEDIEKYFKEEREIDFNFDSREVI